jgi:hypothetical protein
MNALTETAPVSAQALEHILGTGDLSKLSTQQRVEFYAKTCQSLGLNPLTRPFRFMSFQGNTVMYATRDCTDQLRKVNGITLHVVDKQLDGELFIVTVRARDKHGREDEDMGAVTLGQLKGESRANALMKALTKAKRRVTLSICGLGLTDEAELDTMPGSTTFDADDETPVAPMRAAAATTPRAPRVAEKTEAPQRTEEQWRTWVDKLRQACAVLYSRQEVVEIGERASVTDAIATGPGWVRAEVSKILAENYARFGEEPEAEEPTDDLVIHGEEKLAAG